jgi:hypothetical protein
VISQDLFKRKEEEWAPFMERLGKRVKRKKFAGKARLAVLAIIAAASLFLLTGIDKKPKSFLSAKIPVKNCPVVAVDGGYAVENSSNLWVVFNTGVQK